MTTYHLRSASPAKTRSDVVVVGALQSGKDVRLAAGAEDVAEAYGRKLRPLLSTLGFTGKPGEVLKLPTAGTISSPLLLIVGLGKGPGHVSVHRPHQGRVPRPGRSATHRRSPWPSPRTARPWWGR